MSQFGKLTIRVGKPGEVTTYSLALEKLAATREGICYLLGVVGRQETLKALRACMNAKVEAKYELEDVFIRVGEKDLPARAFRTDETHRFEVRAASLGYGHIHVLFVNTAAGFLGNISDESVYHELKRTVTTPLLRSWVGVISERLMQQGLLAPLHCFNCRCGLITASTEDVDRIVEAGIKDGSLPFRELNVVGV